MATPKRTPTQRAHDLTRIAELYLTGKRQVDIAAELGITQQQVSYDLQEIHRRWRESTLIDINEAKHRELDRLDQLGNMAPYLAVNDVPHCPLRDAKLFGYVSLVHTACGENPNLANVLLGQFCAWVRFAFDVVVSALVGAVTIIVCAGANKEMIGANTRGIIAVVTNVIAVRNGATIQLVGNTVGRSGFAINSHHTVSAKAFGSHPYPAAIVIAFVHLFPKSVKRGITCRACPVTGWPVMPADVSLWGTLENSRVNVRASGYGRRLTAPAQAKAGRVRIVKYCRASFVVPADKALGLPLDPSLSPRSVLRNRGRLPASTLAVAIGDFIRGFVRGMIAHADSASNAVGQALGCSNSARANLLFTGVF